LYAELCKARTLVEVEQPTNQAPNLEVENCKERRDRPVGIESTVADRSERGRSEGGWDRVRSLEVVDKRSVAEEDS
jgi:hypothetical protein